MKLGEVSPHPEWKLLFEAFEKSDYDTFISHQEIEKILGHKRKQSPSKYYGFVERWKREMLEKASRQVECQNSRGYRIVKPEEFRKSATRQLKFGQRRIKHAAKIVVNTPVELLSDDEKKKTGDIGNLISQVIFFQKTTLKKVRAIDRKTNQLLLEVGKAFDVAD